MSSHSTSGQYNYNPAMDDDSSPRVPRRTAMACQFCRGRKLKCDGSRPSCGNCNRRGYPCVYTPVYDIPSHPRTPLIINSFQGFGTAKIDTSLYSLQVLLT
ncbi:hypothetical protein BDR07DRAFT_95329 [Suillus spraguei]|nr:hypothetical protein BDR07DRAFT_704243 [Suillus spraguei]KAG2360999.1 hypothetical protein BDR07DRAFT_95329 [Suillus spraguei]